MAMFVNEPSPRQSGLCVSSSRFGLRSNIQLSFKAKPSQLGLQFELNLAWLVNNLHMSLGFKPSQAMARFVNESSVSQGWVAR
ncbi:hypothetical protein HanIR_Chr05g0231871 [Helianthus annuus]|nr:hypothetical protein HanIR_Chr05g0231871 [Helianthus annuus]